MKKINLFLIAILFSLALATLSFADFTEKARVIKFDTETHDLIVERNSGEQLLIQHNRLCSSMDTEFPVDLIWSGEEITQLKVAANEICKVYNTGTYSDDIVITKRIKSPTFLIADHLAEIEWDGITYKIDYESGCKNLKYFVGDIAYIYTETNSLTGATLYLPSNRGQCTINSATYLSGEAESPIDTPITNVHYKAENNEVYFYWDAPEEEDKWIFLISRSKYQIDPDDYHWRQMPNLEYTAENTHTVETLANDQKYYFYLSARDYDGNVAPWTEFEITPVQTRLAFHNNPDFDLFEIELVESTKDYYKVSWPDKSDNSRAYLVQLYVNGKRTLFDILKTDDDGNLANEMLIPIEAEYEGGEFRFILRSYSKERYGTKYSDSIFWESSY
ncbi:hypothetical protein KJ742_03380 [Patescibacteria group bacterium]|nr:hypothetical protein [Patescibacteria group bacterium]MBU1682962.1 hypothetical protein [Patescibacteria group bacterium]MBU1934874.1 hypothetical protein [Patescibacteria group bacterium]